MKVDQQLSSGRLVCPSTRQQLSVTDDRLWLATEDGANRYRLLNKNVPILHTNEAWAKQYAASSANMTTEYSLGNQERKSTIHKIKKWLVQENRDYRSQASVAAFAKAFENTSEQSLCLSVGGGPNRPHAWFTNLNLDAFPNVDIVADAHHLPYADNSVDAICCEAVLEHLHTPDQAASEMYRVCRPGGRAFFCTPFLQGYHGYPHHYHNFTLTGHRRLVERAGFTIMEAGACVGPVFTMVTLGQVFLCEYFPHRIRAPMQLSWAILGAVLKPLDKFLVKRNNAHILASTTYVLAVK